MGIFDKVDKANRQHVSNWIREGRYIVRVDSVATGEGRKDEFWKLEMTVAVVIDDVNETGHKYGEQVTRMRMSKQEGTLPEWKAFVCCVLPDTNEDDIDDDFSEALACGPESEAAGKFIEVHARTIETKAGNNFTRLDYTRLIEPDELAEQLDEDRLTEMVG